MSDQKVFYKDTDETHWFWMIIQNIEIWNGVGGNLGGFLIPIKNILLE